MPFRSNKIFNPPEPRTRVDDKAASLEDAIQKMSADFKKERFVHIFISMALFDGLMIAIGSSALATFFITCSIIILIGLGKWLDFPWVAVYLERWHGRFERLFDGWFGERKDEIEPPPSTTHIPSSDSDPDTSA